MNEELKLSIIKYIISSLTVNHNNYQSLINNEFYIDKTISYEEDGNTIKSKIYACECEILDKKIYLSICKIEDEFYILFRVDNLPSYGISQDSIDISTNGINWIPCDTLNQCSFLTGFETLKQSFLKPLKAKNDNYDIFINYIKYKNE